MHENKHVKERELWKGGGFCSDDEYGVSFFVLLHGWVGINVCRFRSRDICSIFIGATSLANACCTSTRNIPHP